MNAIYFKTKCKPIDNDYDEIKDDEWLEEKYVKIIKNVIKRN